MISVLSEFFKKKSQGATAIEYALIASLIAVIAISGMRLVGEKIRNQLNNIAANLG